MDNYRTIKVPIKLFYSIQEIINHFKELDFNTPTEFVKDAIRRRIEEFIIIMMCPFPLIKGKTFTKTDSIATST